jgi:hypothetical protein
MESFGGRGGGRGFGGRGRGFSGGRSRGGFGGGYGRRNFNRGHPTIRNWNSYNYWPWGYSNPDVYVTPIYVPASEVDDQLRPLPTHWIGKILIRNGEKISTAYVKNPNLYIFESSIQKPYIILRTTNSAQIGDDTISDYVFGRIIIYVNAKNIIENVTYG